MPILWSTPVTAAIDLHPACSMGDVLIQAFGENIALICGSAGLTIILLLALAAYKDLRTSRNRLRLKEIEADAHSLEEGSKGMLRKTLKQSRSVMKEKEHRYLRGIERDNHILSRRVLFLMNEVEEKSHRVELGSNEVYLKRKLDDIQQREAKIFKDSYRYQKGR